MQTPVPARELGWQAADFRLPATDGRIVTLDDAAGPKGTVVMFLCNHCPYVKAVLDRIVALARDLEPEGVRCVAICSNDATAYPEDSFEKMREMAERHAFPFPYLHDESQDVARTYGAACTPDFFGLDAGRRLRYRGRLDASGRSPAPPGARRELYEAMVQIARTGAGPAEQVASIGCSIKWKAA